jgi:hypothetical protein
MKNTFINPHFFIPGNSFTILSLLLILLFAFISQTLSQPDTVFVKSDVSPGEGNLNSAVKMVTAAGKLSGTIFTLEPNGYYILTDSILVPAGEHLTISAPEPGITQKTAPPQIVCTSDTGTIGVYSSPVSYMFYCFGDLTLNNIWLLCANTNGWQVGACIIFKDAPYSTAHKCNFNGVIIDNFSVANLGGGSVTVACKNFSGMFKNSYWKNCTDPHFRYYGRAVSFPFEINTISDWHIDNLIFENCTFANMGYVYMQENTHYADYVKFNHCTFLNVVMYSLESGWWNKLAVTNSIFVNTFMNGDIPGTYEYDPPYSFNEPNGGILRIDSASTFGFKVPFNDQNRCILFANSSYYIEKWLNDWMYYNPGSVLLREQGHTDLIQQPQPMLSPVTINFFDSHDTKGKKSFPYMNKAALYDSADPGFIVPATDSSAIKTFLYDKWYTGGADYAWPWKRENSISRLWQLEENLAYTNDTLKTAGMDSFPLGDLYHWWPEEYSKWKLHEENENARISYWLNTGQDSMITEVRKQPSGVNKYELSQNYPNPFNPSTIISYQLPKDGVITLKVFDILGREVITLVKDYKTQGTYAVSFDASKLASGVYFYQLRAGNFISTKKMLLLK